MSKNLEAIYEHGVFRPLGAVNLLEHQQVHVIVEEEEDWLDTEYMERCAREADNQVQLAMVRQALAKIPGSLTADFIVERSEP